MCGIPFDHIRASELVFTCHHPITTHTSMMYKVCSGDPAHRTPIRMLRSGQMTYHTSPTHGHMPALSIKYRGPFFQTQNTTPILLIKELSRENNSRVGIAPSETSVVLRFGCRPASLAVGGNTKGAGSGNGGSGGPKKREMRRASPRVGSPRDCNSRFILRKRRQYMQSLSWHSPHAAKILCINNIP